MKGLIIAIQFLTRLPTPRIAVSEDEFAQSMAWFPVVGLIIGAIVAGGSWAGASIDTWIGALTGVVLWVVVTGALHLDGLGDIADAQGAAHKDRTRLLAALADPHIGSFAAVAIGLQLIAKLVLLHACIALAAWPAIIALPFAARIGPLVWTRLLPPLHQGLAARFRDHAGWPLIFGWLILLLGLAWIGPALIAAPMLILLWAAYLRRTLGGISGDGHGAGIELVETGLLLAAIIAARAGVSG